jgi:hypothetical protein
MCEPLVMNRDVPANRWVFDLEEPIQLGGAYA